MKEPIRILYILWSGELGGAERHVYDLATSLPEEQFRPTVCFLSTGSIYGELLRQCGIPVVEFGLRNGYDLIGLFRFMRWLRRYDLTLVHDHVSAPWARVIIGCIHPRIPILSTEHSTILFFGYNFWRYLWGKLSAQFTTQFIAVSTVVRELLIGRAGAKPAQIEVIPNFVDANRFSQLPNKRVMEIRGGLGIPVWAPLLISIGRLDTGKGFNRLLNLLFPVFNRYPDLNLLIIGEGPLRENLETLIRDFRLEERVHLLGRRLDVNELLLISDVFVLASQYETFGIVAAEAMMAGLPVVAPRLPGLEDVVVSGSTGFLVEEQNLETGFSSAVEYLIEHRDIRTQMGCTGRERAMALFERQNVIARIINIYQELIRDRV